MLSVSDMAKNSCNIDFSGDGSDIFKDGRFFVFSNLFKQPLFLEYDY